MTNILFLGVTNTARSQMAEALARRVLGTSVRATSVGSRPAAVISPYAIVVLAEIGVDMSGQQPKGWDVVAAQTFDLVVTLCAEAECPRLAGVARRLHWPIDDPVSYPSNTPPEAILTHFRRARDAIVARLGGLAVELRGQRVNATQK
jgi:arsenate reductase